MRELDRQAILDREHAVVVEIWRVFVEYLSGN